MEGQIPPRRTGSSQKSAIRDQSGSAMSPITDSPPPEAHRITVSTGAGPRLRARATRVRLQFALSGRPFRRARAKWFVPKNSVPAAAAGTNYIRSTKWIVPISARELKGDRPSSTAQTRPHRRAQPERRGGTRFWVSISQNSSPHPPPDPRPQGRGELSQFRLRGPRIDCVYGMSGERRAIPEALP